MKKKSLSQAKNTMRRALADLLDPPPGESGQRLLRERFADRCAYCGKAAPRRDGHVDHADPNRGNGLGNLLIACKECNGDEKREMGWEQFVEIKCGGDVSALAARRARILAWLGRHPTKSSVTSPAILEARNDAEAVIAAYEVAYTRLRDLVVAHQAPEGRHQGTEA